MSLSGPTPLLRRIFIERRAVILPLLVAFVVNVGVLLLLVLPLRQGVKGAEEDALNARVNLAGARAAEKGAKQAQAGKERADQEMKKFYAEILPRNFDAAANLIAFWPLKIAEQSRVKWSSGTTQTKPLQEPSNLVKVSSKATLTGEYADIRRFLYEIETAEQFVIIESVELSQSGSAQSSGVLEVSLEIATYYVNETAAEKPARTGNQ
jgi:Tfp pilus assembly protein PilO